MWSRSASARTALLSLAFLLGLCFGEPSIDWVPSVDLERLISADLHPLAVRFQKAAQQGGRQSVVATFQELSGNVGFRHMGSPFLMTCDGHKLTLTQCSWTGECDPSCVGELGLDMPDPMPVMTLKGPCDVGRLGSLMDKMCKLLGIRCSANGKRPLHKTGSVLTPAASPSPALSPAELPIPASSPSPPAADLAAAGDLVAPAPPALAAPATVDAALPAEPVAAPMPDDLGPSPLTPPAKKCGYLAHEIGSLFASQSKGIAGVNDALGPFETAVERALQRLTTIAAHDFAKLEQIRGVAPTLKAYVEGMAPEIDALREFMAYAFPDAPADAQPVITKSFVKKRKEAKLCEILLKHNGPTHDFYHFSRFVHKWDELQAFKEFKALVFEEYRTLRPKQDLHSNVFPAVQMPQRFTLWTKDLGGVGDCAQIPYPRGMPTTSSSPSFGPMRQCRALADWVNSELYKLNYKPDVEHLVQFELARRNPLLGQHVLHSFGADFVTSGESRVPTEYRHLVVLRNAVAMTGACPHLSQAIVQKHPRQAEMTLCKPEGFAHCWMLALHAKRVKHSTSKVTLTCKSSTPFEVTIELFSKPFAEAFVQQVKRSTRRASDCFKALEGATMASDEDRAHCAYVARVQNVSIRKRLLLGPLKTSSSQGQGTLIVAPPRAFFKNDKNEVVASFFLGDIMSHDSVAHSFTFISSDDKSEIIIKFEGFNRRYISLGALAYHARDQVLTSRQIAQTLRTLASRAAALLAKPLPVVADSKRKEVPVVAPLTEEEKREEAIVIQQQLEAFELQLRMQPLLTANPVSAPTKRLLKVVDAVTRAVTPVLGAKVLTVADPTGGRPRSEPSKETGERTAEERRSFSDVM